MNAMFKTNLKHVPTRVTVSPRVVWPLLDGPSLFEYLNHDLVSYVWVCTYTISRDHILKKPIQRLIYSVGPTRLMSRRRFSDIHTKLYITFNRDHIPMMAYVGSQNLVKPTTHNLSLAVCDRTQIEQCVDYFNRLWLS